MQHTKPDIDIFTSGRKLSLQLAEKERLIKSRPSLSDLKEELACRKIKILVKQAKSVRWFLKSQKIEAETEVLQMHTSPRIFGFNRSKLQSSVYGRGWWIYQISFTRHDPGGWGPPMYSTTTYGVVALTNGKFIEVKKFNDGLVIFSAVYDYRNGKPPSFISPLLAHPLKFSYELKSQHNYVKEIRSSGKKYSTDYDIKNIERVKFICAFADTFESQLIQLVAKYKL